MNRETTEAYVLGGIGAAYGVYNVFIKPEITAKRTWALIGGIVAAHEIACPSGELLSEGADKALERHPVLTTLAIGTVALHLANLLPSKLDPLHQTVNFIRGVRHGK